jgi:hypothetical protein
VTARRVLFGRERFTAELDWAGLARLLPGWEVVASPPDQIADHLDGVAAVCPFGAWVDRPVLDAGSFGLVHQYEVGLEKVARARRPGLRPAAPSRGDRHAARRRAHHGDVPPDRRIVHGQPAPLGGRRHAALGRERSRVLPLASAPSVTDSRAMWVMMTRADEFS